MNCVIWSVFKKTNKKNTQSLFVLKDWVLYTQDYCNAKYTPSLFQSYFMMRTLIFLLCSTWVYLHAFIVTMRPNYVWIKMSTVTWNTPACKNMLSSSSNLVFYAHLTSMVISGRNVLRKYRSVSNLSVQPDLGQHFVWCHYCVLCFDSHGKHSV